MLDQTINCLFGGSYEDNGNCTEKKNTEPEPTFCSGFVHRLVIAYPFSLEIKNKYST